MSKIWSIFMTDQYSLYFGTVFFGSLWRSWKLIFWQKKFNILYSCFPFIQKAAELVQLLVIESWPTLLWVAFLILLWLVCDMSSHLFDLILAWSASLQVSYQNSNISRQKVQPPKFNASAWDFPISETGSKCSLACWLTCWE